MFKYFYIPVFEYPLRSTKGLVETAVDGVTIYKVVRTAGEYGYKTKIDLILPDNLKEGIKPVTIQCSYDGAGIIGAVTKAM